MGEFQKLLEGGFSKEEARSYTMRKRQQLLEGGFSEQEIKNHLGVQRFDDVGFKQEVINYASNTLKERQTERTEKVEDAPDVKVKVPGIAGLDISPEVIQELGEDWYIQRDDSVSIADSAQTGFQSSIAGLGARQQLPDLELPETNNTFNKIAQGAGTLVGDLPAMWLGSILGGPNPVTATAGAFMLPAALRKMYIDKLEQGEVTSFTEFWERFVSVAWEGTKAGVVGAVTGGAGKYAPSYATIPAEVTAMTTAGAVLEGRVPELDEFYEVAKEEIIESLFMVGGARFVRPMKTKLQKTYTDTNKTPSQVAEDGKYEASIADDLASKNIDVPRAYVDPPSDPATLKTSYNDIKKIHESINKGEVGQRRTVKQTFEDLYTGLVDKYHPLKDGVQKFDANDPYYSARMLAGLPGKAEHWIKFKPFDIDTLKNIPGSKSLQDILLPIKDFQYEFEAYLVAKRAWELETSMPKVPSEKLKKLQTRRNRTKDPAKIKDLDAQIKAEEIALSKIPTVSGVDLDSAARTIQQFELDSKYGKLKFKESMKDLQDYQNHLLDYLKKSGVVSKESVDIMRTLNQHYVPFQRVPEVLKGTLPKGTKVYNIIKRLHGSQKQLIPPTEAIVKNTYAILTLAERNKVNQKIAKKFGTKVKQPGRLQKLVNTEVDNLVEDMEDGKQLSIYRPQVFAPEGKYLTVFENGKKEFYEVPESVMSVVQGMDRSGAGLLEKVLSPFARTLRAGAVLNPDFWLKNPIRDQFVASIYSKYGYVFGSNIGKNMASILNQDAMYQKWVKSGGANAALVSMDRDYMQGQLKDLYKLPVRNAIREMNPLTAMERGKDVVKSPIEALRVLTELTENVTRLNEFRLGVEKGADIREAGFASREVTQDFQRIGAYTQALNQITAFFNAQVQGIDRFARASIENPKQTLVKTATHIAMPSMLIALANEERIRANPDDPISKALREIPAWQRDLYWLIPAGDTIYRIPKPFEIGVIAGSSIERFVQYLYREQPGVNHLEKAFEGYGHSFMESMKPNIWPTAVVPMVESWGNKKLFFDTPLVSGAMERLLPELQATQRTPMLLKGISKVLGKLPPLRHNNMIGPIHLQNYVRSWTGGLGAYILDAVDAMVSKSEYASDIYKELRVFEPQQAARTLADIPVVRTFIVRYPTMNTQSVNKFYERRETIMQEINSFRTMYKSLPDPEPYQTEKEESYMEYEGLISGAEKAISEMTQALTALKYDIVPDEYIGGKLISGEQAKREEMEKLYIEIVNIAKEANEEIDATAEFIKEDLNKG